MVYDESNFPTAWSVYRSERHLRLDLSIRPLRAEDTDGIIRIYDSAMAVEPAIGPVSRSQWEGFVGQPQNRNGEDFRVALNRNLLIGHAESSLRDQGRGRVRYCKLVVAPAYRRQGVASALMNSLLKIDQPDDKLSFQAVAASDWTAGTAFLTTLAFSYLESDLAMRCMQLVSPADTLSQPLSLEYIVDPASVAPDVARIHNAAYRSDVAFRIFTPEEMAADLSGEDLWIARDSDQIIGFCRISLEPTLVWIESLAVHPDYHGRGIGKALAYRALRSVGGGSDRLAGLNVSSANSSAQAVYARLGFTSGREQRRFSSLRNHLVAVMERRQCH
jgi:ribosomal protein S18 acetylase RimI-like enzyme